MRAIARSAAARSPTIIAAAACLISSRIASSPGSIGVVSQLARLAGRAYRRKRAIHCRIVPRSRAALWGVPAAASPRMTGSPNDRALACRSRARPASIVVCDQGPAHTTRLWRASRPRSRGDPNTLPSPLDGLSPASAALIVHASPNCITSPRRSARYHHRLLSPTAPPGSHRAHRSFSHSLRSSQMPKLAAGIRLRR